MTKHKLITLLSIVMLSILIVLTSVGCSVNSDPTDSDTGNNESTELSSDIAKDPEFGTAGVVTLQGDSGRNLFLSDDGSIFGLSMNSESGIYYLEKFDATGSAVTSFGTDGIVELDITDYIPGADLSSRGTWISGINGLSDGSLIIVGAGSSTESGQVGFILKLTAVGEADTSFYVDGIFDISEVSESTETNGVFFRPVASEDGLLLSSSISDGTLFKLTEDGFDPVWGGDSGFVFSSVFTDAGYTSAYLSSLTIDSEGNLLGSGQASVSSTNYGFAVALNSSAELLTSKFTDGMYASVAAEGNQKSIGQIVIANDGTLYAVMVELDTLNSNAVVKAELLHFDASGVLDPDFGTDGSLGTERMGAVFSDAAGVYLIGSADGIPVMQRYTEDGLDATFSSEGTFHPLGESVTGTLYSFARNGSKMYIVGTVDGQGVIISYK